MLPQEVIARKRDGQALTRGEIEFLIGGMMTGRVSDAQIAAFAMAVLWRGLDGGERAALTETLRDSGRVLRWALDGPVIDKHSTGGIGDAVSLVLAPALAACGGYVPMISGRGLGHTGGTLDKLEAIPGYRVDPDPETFARVVAEVGCAIIGQTAELAPADRRLYAIRDVTATVESIDLIVASILSKKLAAGIEALVLDVKVGSGAFMPGLEAARALAAALVEAGRAAGCRTSALLTDMDAPLAPAAGTALEVAAAVRCLTGDPTERRLRDVSVALGGRALALAGLAADAEAGARAVAAALASGAAAERFERMVAALGGPRDLVAAPAAYLPRAPRVEAVPAPATGFVAAIDCRALGYAVIELGGGRRQPSDRIDPAAGIDAIIGLGARVSEGEPLARVHGRDQAALAAAAARVRDAFVIHAAPPEQRPLVLGQVG